ncbi:MAG: substrate-binding domain-containing protein [Chloroflexi bacterium]|nr:substrate-binding domain-containing protein [Chloroflexota bacterium]
MKRHITLFTLLSLLLILALAACGGTPTETAPAATEAPVAQPTEAPAAAPTEAPVEQPTEAPAADTMGDLTCAEPVKIGLITDQTGALAIYGAHIMRGFPLGMEYATGSEAVDNGDYTSYMLNGCEFQVYTRDDQSTPDITATVARELIEDIGVDILVGTVSSGATATLQELARENQIPLIVAPAAANDITGVAFNEYTFRTSRNNYQDAVNICEYLTQEYSTFVQIAPDYSFGYGGAAAFRDACTLFGGEFVADDIFAPADTTEFTPYMEQVMDSGAQAFLVTWAGGGFVPMMQAAQELGVFDQMAMASGFVDNVVLPTFFANAIGTTSGILYHYTAPDNPINDWLVEQTKARFGVPPDLFDADGMNAAIMLVEAVKKTSGDVSADAMIGAMEGMSFEGPKGTIDIRAEDHVAIQDMYIVTLTNVDDPDFKFFDLVKTTRPNVPCLLPEGLQDRCGDLPIGALGDISQTQAPAEEAAMGGTAVCTEPVKVGLITDATGALAIYGTHILRSFPYGLEYATGAPVEVVADNQWNFQLDDCPIEVYVRDDQSTPDTTATVARELIEDIGVDILVGTVSSGATATLQELARENQIPLIVAPAAANDITGVAFNEYTFRTSRNNYQDAVNICQYLVNDYSTFVQIAPDYSFGYGGAAAFRDACTLFGGEFVADDIFAPADTTEFTPYMEQVMDSGAQAFLVTWAGGGFVPMMQAAQELGVMDEQVMASAFVDNVVLPTFFANAIGTTSGILYHYTAANNEINDWLVSKTMENQGVPPDLFDADAMNAALLIANALRATGGDVSAEAMIAAMEGMEFEGPKGTIYIRPEDHVAIQDMYIVTLTNVDDPEFRFFDYVATTRPDVPCLLPEELKDRCGDLPYGSLSGE